MDSNKMTVANWNINCPFCLYIGIKLITCVFIYLLRQGLFNKPTPIPTTCPESCEHDVSHEI